MDDKCLMESLLMSVKGVCDLYLHGTIESSTENIHAVFCELLTETLKLQHEIYKKMEAKGWYQVEQAEEQKIQQEKQKHTMK